MIEDPNNQPRIFNCSVEQVHSGDDIIAMVDLRHDGMFKKTRMRLKGVDTPDAYKAARDTPAGRIREQVRSILIGSPCRVEQHAEGKGGGWVVTLHVYDNGEWINLNERLIEMGYVYAKREDS